MAEDSDLEKTEPATPRRKEKAREEGQVARSRELGTFMALIFGIGAIWSGGDLAFQTFRSILSSGLWFDTRVASDTQIMLNVAGKSAMEAFLMVMPFFLMLLVIGILAAVALSGFLISAKALEPKFNRLGPLKGIKRLFGLSTLIELLKTLAKAGLVGIVGVKVILFYKDDMLVLTHLAPTEALAEGLAIVATCCMWIAASLILVVLIDVPWQIYNNAKQLRMSKEDVKQEHKDSEGDPHVKGRIRSQQRSMARRRMLTAVPAADVVVTNPTHYAVALSYSENSDKAPVVVAKGMGLIAAKIREIAKQNNVATLEAPALARALHHNVELDQEIPDVLYKAVAEVLAWVFQLRSWHQGIGILPSEPTDLAVPPELDPLQRGQNNNLIYE